MVMPRGRPVSNLPEDVLAQKLYLGRIERDLLHEFAKPFKNLSIAARALIQIGARALDTSLSPGQHSMECHSEDFQKLEVRVALDLRRDAHQRAFKQLTETIAELDRETKESLQ